MRAFPTIVLFLAASLMACGDDVQSLLPDLSIDTTQDSVSDVGDDAPTADGIDDVETDVGDDVVDADTPPEVAEDVESDVELDAETDVESDTDADANADVAVDGDTPGDTGPDETPPSVRSVNPLDGEELGRVQIVTFFFDESIDRESIVLGGTLGEQAGDLFWTETSAVDDTLTVRAGTLWEIADGASLNVSFADLSGNSGTVFDVSFDVRCRSNGECVSPDRCDEGFCVATPCEEPSVCSGFDGCVDGFCDNCRTSDDCEPTEECSRTQCLPLPTCESADDCGDGVICRDNICTGCSTDDECSAAYGSRNGCAGSLCAGLATEFCAAFGQTCGAGEGCSRLAANEYVCAVNGCSRFQIFDGTGCTDIGLL